MITKLKKVVITVLVALSPLSVMAYDDPAAADTEADFLGGNFTGWVEFGNERMFRGNSETQNSEVPSLQGLLTWTHADTGIYAGYWMATNKFDLVPSIYAESGPFVGKFGTASVGTFGFNYNVFLWHYIYHNSDGRTAGDVTLGNQDPTQDLTGRGNTFEPNYTELWFTANKDVTDNLNIYVEFVPTLDAWFGIKDARGRDVMGYSSAITPTYQLGNGWAVNATLGYQWFSKPEFTPVGDWMYGSVGVTKSFDEGWKGSLSYHNTNVDSAREDPTEIWEDQLVVSISKSF